MSLAKRKLLFTIFSVGLIISHYALSFIFLFLILLTYWLSPFLTSSDAKLKKLITGDLVVRYLVITIVWYVVVTPSPLDALTSTINHIYRAFSSQVSAPGISGLMPGYVSPLHSVAQYIFYFLQLSIIVGVVGSILSYQKIVGLFSYQKIVGLFSYQKIVGLFRSILNWEITNEQAEYLSMSLLSLSILILCIGVPSFAAGLVVSRFYHITLFLLAPFVVIGILAFSDAVANLRRHLHVSRIKRACTRNKSKDTGLFLASILIVLLFLFQTGFIYEIARDVPSSLSLSWNRLKINPNLAMDVWRAQTPEQDVFGAKWLSKNTNSQALVYADRMSSSLVLLSYGGIKTVYTYREDLRLWIYNYILSPKNIPITDAYVYLRTVNTVYGKIENEALGNWNITTFSPFLDSCDKIYSNGNSEIYINPL